MQTRRTARRHPRNTNRTRTKSNPKGGTVDGCWADNGNVNASNFPNVGGNWNNGDNAGPFNANFNNSASNTNSNISSRLCYRAGRNKAFGE